MWTPYVPAGASSRRPRVRSWGTVSRRGWPSGWGTASRATAGRWHGRAAGNGWSLAARGTTGSRSYSPLRGLWARSARNPPPPGTQTTAWRPRHCSGCPRSDTLRDTQRASRKVIRALGYAPKWQTYWGQGCNGIRGQFPPSLHITTVVTSFYISPH